MTTPTSSTPPPATSVFLDRPASDRVAENDLAFALRDGFPVSPGHTLVIPKRLVPTWFDATPDEQRGLFALIDLGLEGTTRTGAPPDVLTTRQLAEKVIEAPSRPSRGS